MATSYLESKCKGRYRLKTPIDPTTNDFFREKLWNKEHTKFKWGEYLRSEVYINCLNGMIYHVGGNILEAYVQDVVTRGGKIKRTANGLKRRIKNKHSALILKEMQIDDEFGGSFRFKYKDLDSIAKMMGAYILGANMNPFDTKNLSVDDYEIPEIDKESFDKLKKKKEIPFSKFTMLYNDYVKEQGMDSKEFIRDRKLQKLKPLEYIHSNYEWKDFLSFIKEWA